MLAELRTKSQITIPKEIVAKLGISVGDKLEIFEKDGMICLIQVSIYSKNYIGTLREEIEELKSNIKNGKQPVFDNIDLLFDKLENN